MNSTVKGPDENRMLMRTMPAEGFADNVSLTQTQSMDHLESTYDYTRKEEGRPKD